MAAHCDLQLLLVVKDLHASIQELSECHGRDRRPITDGSASLHRLCTRLEYLLQYDQKEKKSILGTRKDYWDYFCVCLNGHRCGVEVLKFVNGTPKLSTSLGKGRAFIRYCLVWQQLADSLQLCFHNQKLVSDWYYARSPFLSDRLREDIVEQLYALNAITFDLPLMGVDLDTSWPIARWETPFDRPVSRTSPNGTESRRSVENESTQGIPSPTAATDAETDKLKTSTRISRRDPSNSSFKGMSKNTSQDPEEDQVDTEGTKESGKTDVRGVTSGTAETAGISDNDGHPTGRQTLALETAESGSTPEQLPQSEHGAPVCQQEERAIGVHQVSNCSVQPLEGSDIGGPGKGQGVVTILAAGDQREGELSKEAEQQSLIEELKRELQEKEHIIEELQGLLKEKEKIKVEECSKHQREIATLQEMQKESAEKLNRLGQLEDSNKFLNETVEEMDSILDGLRRALAAKEQEDILLRKEQMEKMAAAEQVHQEEMERLKLVLRGHRERGDEMEQEGNHWPKESTLASVQSGKELEVGEPSMEMKNLQSKLRCLESLNKSLEGKYQQSQQQIRELEMSVVSLQSEVGRLQGCEQQTWDTILPPDRNRREANENLEGNMRMIQTESEKLEDGQLEREGLAEEGALLLESLTALEQEKQQAQEKISDLDQQLSPEENRNTAAKNDRCLNTLKEKLEEIILKLEPKCEEKPDIKAKLEEALAQLSMLTAELTEPRKRAVDEVLAEEKMELSLLQTEDTEVGYSLQEASSEIRPTQRNPFSELSTLDKSTREVAQVKKQMEELEYSHGQMVQRMEERIESLKAERESLECQKEDLEKKVSALEEDLLQLKDTAGKLELDNSKVRSELQEAQATVGELRARSVRPTTNAALDRAAVKVKQRQEECAAGGMQPAVGQLSCPTQEEGVSAPHDHSDFPTDGTGTGVTEEKSSSREAEVKLLVASLTQAKVTEEELRQLLKKAQEDAKSREEECRDLKEMVVSLKERTVQLLREKDLLWQKAERLESPQLAGPKASLRRNQLGSKKGI
ncbi:FYVE and coiled-coil domain-containing protein 1-like [Pristis pectinata]|uniref:FYVE and coiled-coil domain-containing protein 1-like n=1 Tax=Pristis pectinata TaxID=685728 RepID=UPI00223D053B|nr:FYVE and coiled-coil domain-containing protein 1-like [Pristis pectinata]XP_051870181.1 FYVE and coiled-coil domain-containing protein 1-like [Pristis pectinata]